MRISYWLLGAVVLVAASPLAVATEPSKTQTLPFNAAEDVDGARSVWFAYQRAGMPYDFLPASRFPESPCFLPAAGNVPQIGDVGWWKEFIAIYDPGLPQPPGAVFPLDLRTHDGPVAHRSLEAKYGPVKWFRLAVPCKPKAAR